MVRVGGWEAEAIKRQGTYRSLYSGAGGEWSAGRKPPSSIDNPPFSPVPRARAPETLSFGGSRLRHSSELLRQKSPWIHARGFQIALSEADVTLREMMRVCETIMWSQQVEDGKEKMEANFGREDDFQQFEAFTAEEF